MERRVEPLAKWLWEEGAFRKEGAFEEVATFSPSVAADKRWEELMRNYPSGVPDWRARWSLMFREDEAWIRRMVKEGYTIVDAGQPASYGPSTFYEMERRVVYGR